MMPGGEKPSLTVWRPDRAGLAALAAALWLAGCDSPSMKFQGIAATRVEVAGSVFSVRHTRYEAEAIGRGFQPGARRRAQVIKGIVAIEKASGCPVKVRSVRGDTNIVAADLKCPDAPPRVPLNRERWLECLGYPVGGPAGGHLDIDCRKLP